MDILVKAKTYFTVLHLLILLCIVFLHDVLHVIGLQNTFFKDPSYSITFVEYNNMVAILNGCNTMCHDNTTDTNVL